MHPEHACEALLQLRPEPLESTSFEFLKLSKMAKIGHLGRAGRSARQKKWLSSIWFWWSRAEFDDFFQLRHRSPSQLAGEQRLRPGTPWPVAKWQTCL